MTELNRQSGENEERIIEIEIERLRPFKEHPFQVKGVLHCISGNTTKVKNIKKYLLAALFNAPSTMNGYYQAEVNHDMPGLVR